MKGKISAIATICNFLILTSYFLFADRESVGWTVFYFGSNFVYIALILLDHLLTVSNKHVFAIIFSGISFQVLYALFLVFLGIISKNYQDFVRLYAYSSWSLILALVVIIYLFSLRKYIKWEKR
jgi:hypothetical protein